jgi:hypothetical protein
VFTFDVDDLRLRRRGEGEWIELRDSRWEADALLAVTPPRWTSDGRRVLTDSLLIPWTEIERIERPSGTQAGLGAGVGAAIGLGVGLALAAADEADCNGYLCGLGYIVLPLLAVPAGVIAGALIGSTQHRWAPFFCAAPPTAGDATPPAEAGE